MLEALQARQRAPPGVKQLHSAAREPESAYAWTRLAMTLFVGTFACVGTWSVVVFLPSVQQEFGTDRAQASLPYTFMMLGFATGTMFLGRIADKRGLPAPMVIGGLLLLVGYSLASVATSLWQFALLHVLIGIGSGAGFGPLMADTANWFTRRRGFALAMAACGSYLAGVFWPQAIKIGIEAVGWRTTHLWIGITCAAVMIPVSLFFRTRPSESSLAAATRAANSARSDLGLSPRTLQIMLTAAGVSCCVAMSMPQVHLVAYCGDLGYGVARGADMLSLMLGLGIVSRLGSGVLADRIGGVATLLLGSFMQGLALFLYLWFDSLTSLYVITGIFGLFQGGIVPMYAIIIRQFLPPAKAGAQIGLVVSATIVGMALGGYLNGVIFDLTSSYRMAFLNGLMWNLLNLSIAAWLLLGPKRELRPA